MANNQLINQFHLLQVAKLQHTHTSVTNSNLFMNIPFTLASPTYLDMYQYLNVISV